MELIILGSGTAVPTERATAGYLVKTDVPIVMDIGRGTFSNLCKVQDRNEISNILFSHHHVDHYSDILPFLQTAIHESQDKPRRDIEIAGPLGTKTLFSKFLSLPGMDRGTFKISLMDVSNMSFHIGKTRIITHEVYHVDNLHCNGYRIEYGGKVLAYSGDSRVCDEVMELCKDADVAVLDCSVPKGFSREHHLGKNHMGVIGCGKIAEQANVKRLVLSHLYPACDGHDLIKECRENFDGEILIARDLMKVNV